MAKISFISNKLCKTGIKYLAQLTSPKYKMYVKQTKKDTMLFLVQFWIKKIKLWI